MNSRQRQILEQLAQEHKIDVSTLATRLAVSSVTMRKDLDSLEEMGLIRRMHGFAVIGSRDNLANRLAYHYEDKRRIARLAAECVGQGETVMIESGSCCALLAAELATSQKDVTIITNSAFIADYVRGQSRVKVILLGGEYQFESQVMVGPLTAQSCEMFRVDKLFIGTDGYSPRYGFTGEDMMRVSAVKAMRRCAERLMILTESEKFSRQGVVSLMPFEEVSALFTDAKIPTDALLAMQQKGIEVFRA